MDSPKLSLLRELLPSNLSAENLQQNDENTVVINFTYSALTRQEFAKASVGLRAGAFPVSGTTLGFLWAVRMSLRWAL